MYSPPVKAHACCRQFGIMRRHQGMTMPPSGTLQTQMHTDSIVEPHCFRFGCMYSEHGFPWPLQELHGLN